MAQWLKALAALQEDPSSVLSAHKVAPHHLYVAPRPGNLILLQAYSFSNSSKLSNVFLLHSKSQACSLLLPL